MDRQEKGENLRKERGLCHEIRSRGQSHPYEHALRPALFVRKTPFAAGDVPKAQRKGGGPLG
jgi:hypothetical protein